MSHFGRLLVATLLCATMGVVHAKLPASPPADPAKIEAEKLKKAEAAKKEAEALSKAQDRAAEHYKRSQGGGAMPVKAEMAAKPKAKK
jgi:hypothetical protein